jgi:hypothetical protein
MSSNKTRPHNVDEIRNAVYARCKRWLAVALSLKGLLFAGGTLTVLSSVDSLIAPLVIAALAAASELAMWRSDFVKGVAEAVQRKLDFENSFGWHITNADLRDVLARYATDLQALQEESTSNYFASQEPPGPQRALQNLQESAWWSKHLTESMWKVCLIGICVLVVLCLGLLLTSIQAISDQAVRVSIAKVITSGILLLFSLNLLRSMVGYFTFSKKAEKTEDAASKLLETGSARDIDPIKIWQEYQLARASAPLLPTWMWKLRQRRLNQLWQHYHN